MNKNRYAGLIALNAVLLAVLAMIAIPQSAEGNQRGSRARGEYTMVSGRAQGFTEDAIWIVDNSNQQLLALRWERGKKSLVGIGWRDIAADAEGKGGRR